MRIERYSISVFLLITAFVTSANADGIDLFEYFARVQRHSGIGIIAMIFLLMCLNYLLNLIVVGLAPILKKTVKRGQVFKELIYLTFLGQLADRVGAAFALALTFGISATIKLNLNSTLGTLLISNIIFSGVAVSILAFYFLKRWHVSKPTSVIIAITAGVVTNPVWAFLL